MNSSWNEVALCGPVTAEYDPWFDEDDLELQMEARSICMACPARIDCLLHSLVNDLEYGIFAGLGPEERKPLRDNLLATLPQESYDALASHYRLPNMPEPAVPEELTGHEAAIATKIAMRVKRAEQAYQKLMAMENRDIPHYEIYLDCVRAVLDHPTYGGAELAKTVGRSTAMFNQRLRECFEFCGV